MQLHHALRLPADALSVVTLVGAGGKTSALFRLAEEARAAGRRVVTTTTTRIFTSQAMQAPVRLVVDAHGKDAIDWVALEAHLARHGHCLLATSLSGVKSEGLPPATVDTLAARAHDLGIGLIAVEGDGSRRRPVKAPAPHEPVIPDCTTHLVPVAGLDGLGLPLDEPYIHRPERVRALLAETDASTRLTPRMLARLLVEPYTPGEGTAPGSTRRLPGARLVALLNKAEDAPRLAAARQIAHRLMQQHQPALIGAVGAAEPDRGARALGTGHRHRAGRGRKPAHGGTKAAAALAGRAIGDACRPQRAGERRTGNDRDHRRGQRAG